ncbi:MAG: chemotaxis protein CheD [Spirochaetales bacterium]|nr:chemotaxis protein CheD [Spirochaetales bacterium]
MYKTYSTKLKNNVVTIFEGEYYITSTKEIISTVLGSCITVCLYDKKIGLSGMNHFLLPKAPDDKKALCSSKTSKATMRYGEALMPALLNAMIKKGAKRKDLAAKIFGGGRIIQSRVGNLSTGDKNIKFARFFLKKEGIPILKESVGNYCGRRIYFLTDSNIVLVRKLELDESVYNRRFFFS